MRKELEKRVEELLKEKVYLEYDEKYKCYIYKVDVPYGYNGISESYIKGIFNSKYPPRECINDDVCDYEAEVKDYLVDELIQECKNMQDVSIDMDDEDLIREYMIENIECNASDSYIWGDVLTTQIILQVEGEANEEFILNQVHDGELYDGSIKWLIEQQGYTKEDFLKLWNGEDSELENNAFLRSVVVEMENVTTSTNKLTLLTRMELKDIVEWNEFLESGMDTDGVLTIPKNIRIGLVDNWNGAGSCIEIKLEKDLKLPIKNIYDVKPDDYYRYSVDSVYGPTHWFWSNEEIKLPEEIKNKLFEK